MDVRERPPARPKFAARCRSYGSSDLRINQAVSGHRALNSSELRMSSGQSPCRRFRNCAFEKIARHRWSAATTRQFRQPQRRIRARRPACHPARSAGHFFRPPAIAANRLSPKPPDRSIRLLRRRPQQSGIRRVIPGRDRLRANRKPAASLAPHPNRPQTPAAGLAC